jgi:nucleotide-binding universal stress UspA family protein
MAELKTILFPTDFSEFSNKAFPYAASLAKAFGAKIIQMHVAELEEEDPANPAHTFPAGDFDGVLETERIIIRGHAPYKDILDVSRAKGCDLIVMATHGRSALSQFFLGGSVAEDVARFSSIPVFIVKVEAASPPESYTGALKEILFPTDLSEAASHAFAYALSFARRFNARLFALHVIEDRGAEVYRAGGLERGDENFQAGVEELVRRHVSALPGSEAVASIHVAEGRAETEIVKFAEAQGIDLIAMGTRGHSIIQDEILGTTADRVIRHAPCPVLAVRG